MAPASCNAMKGCAELPGVRQENGNYIARLDSRSGQSSRHGLNCLAVLGIAQAASVRGVDECGLIAVAAAGIQYQVVQKTALWIRVQLVRSMRQGLYR